MPFDINQIKNSILQLRKNRMPRHGGEVANLMLTKLMNAGNINLCIMNKNMWLMNVFVIQNCATET